MPSMMEMLTQQLGGQMLGQISRQLGADENKTSSAITAALPAIMGALARNASNDEGARSLDNALSKDHDGSILNDLTSFLGRADSGPGAGILRHVFGNRQQNVERSVAKSAGLDMGQVTKLMAILAPVVMGVLGRQKRQQNIGARELPQVLGREREEVQRRAGGSFGMLEKLLDKDGDGDVDLGDLAKHGFGLMGLLKR